MRAGRSRSRSAPLTSGGSGTSPAASRRSTSRSSASRRPMPSLLLEIGCEELPAAACREAEAQLAELASVHIGASPSQLFIGPRRVGFLIEDLPGRTPDEWVKGPPEKLRERAAAGFAKKHGVPVDE